MPNKIRGYRAGVSFWWELPKPLRRKFGQQRGWPEDKIARFVENPDTDEFTGFDHTDTDAWLPMDEFWKWIDDLRAGNMRRPFLIPGQQLPTLEEHARDVELTQRAFGRRLPQQ